MAANADYSAHSSLNLQQPWHTYPVETTLSILGSSAVNGLNREQIAERIKYYGKNELQERPGRSNWQILLDQFTNIMLLLMLMLLNCGLYWTSSCLVTAATGCLLMRVCRPLLNKEEAISVCFEQ